MKMNGLFSLMLTLFVSVANAQVIPSQCRAPAICQTFYAPAFSGNGSQLTGVSGGGGGSTITVTGSQFSGDGSLSFPLTLKASSVTLQGNAFNGTNQLMKLDSSGALPVLSGANLTGVLDTTKVLKTGDTMTGQLTISGSSLTVGGSAFSVGGSTFSIANGSMLLHGVTYFGSKNQASLQALICPALPCEVRGNFGVQDVWVATGTSTAGQWMNGRTGIGPY